MPETAPGPNTGQLSGRTHLLPVRIYYEDTDFTGVVYHANYLRYFERGRSDYLRAVGVDHKSLLEGESPTAFSVTEITVRFRQAARIDDALLVRTSFDEIRGPRLIIAQTLERAGQVIAEAAVEACCISLSGRPKKPPALLVERLKPFLDPSRSMF